MSTNFSAHPGGSHSGTGAHSAGRNPNPLVNYELAGLVRWLDVDLERVVVDVRETDGHAGVFQGRDVTVDLETARVHGAELDGLTPGTPVRVRLRLPRDLRGRIPDLLRAHSVAVVPAT
jgi:hypothetical protein